MCLVPEITSRSYQKVEASDCLQQKFTRYLLTPKEVGSFILARLSNGSHQTCSSPSRPLRSHYIVCSENYLFIVEIGPICDKEI